MILSTENMTEFTLLGQTYPLRCDLIVLEKIQDYVGDILEAEDKLRGFKPRVDSDGVIDRTIGNWTIPDIGLTTKAIFWMLQEAKAVTSGSYEIPSLETLKQQDEYTIQELALIAFREFEDCISGKKKEEKGTVEEDGYQDSSHKNLIDFEWLAFVGMQCGLSFTDVGRMFYWQIQALQNQFKKQHNMTIKQMIWKIDD